jgi:adenine-specific DNA-methyltransferase
MPTLNWIGKEKVVNHHRDVPFRVLEHQYGFSAETGETKKPTGSGNMIIHGDNLEALKALLPEYEGKIKCIYIDPPYNTGEEKWVYNDNVNHPKIKKWLGEVVGKDGEDLSRHDKWLCMMYPRLKLLQRLLHHDGVIFISIDDNEHTNLKILCDEIFGLNRFITSFIWKRRASSQLSKNNVSVDHEYVLCYSRTDNFVFRGVDKDYAAYSNPDNDPNGPWTLGDLTVGMTKDQRPNQFYDLIDPKTGNVFKPNPSRVWSYIPESMEERIRDGKVYFPDDESKRPMTKRYLKDLKSTINPISTWITGLKDKGNLDKTTLKSGLNTEGTKAIQSIFGSKKFDYSKPISLIESLIEQIVSDDDIVLDSFAGSGTTAHAVLNLNKQDGGNRKFILVEMEDYADNITAERVKRVAKGYGEGKKAVEGTGGKFDYYNLGEPLFIGDNQEYLNEAVGVDKIRQYIWYSETRTAFCKPSDKKESEHYLGKQDQTAYFFYYEPNEITTLDHDFLATIKTKAEQYVIYADNCLLSKEFMAKHNIIFKKIPRDITRF